MTDWRYLETRPFDVIVSTYEISLKDKDFLKTITWHCLIIDEGHRAKNADSLLSQTLSNEYDIFMAVLLSGTPIQNNLCEV
jgi:SNF2 family DNA or RNA helicase